MFEIVIVKAAGYKKGDEVWVTEKLKYPKATEDFQLWWFDRPGMTLEKAMMLKNSNFGTWLCDAILFEFDFVPNFHATHAEVSYLHEEFFHASGVKTFQPFTEQFRAIVQPYFTQAPFDRFYRFYGLFELDVDEHRDEDGGLDDLEISAEFRGEINLSKLYLTVDNLLMSKNQPYYSSRE